MMYTLYNEKEYTGKMDDEVIVLCNTLNALPSIETKCSCCGHGRYPIYIYFSVGDSKDGLFFLTRSIDSKYWEYGHDWMIEVQIGDNFVEDKLPIVYLLHSSRAKGDVAYKQAGSLADNMNYLFNNKFFMGKFGLNIGNFRYKETE